MGNASIEDQLIEANELIENGDLREAKLLLQPLIAKKIPEAIFLGSKFYIAGEESVDDFEKRSIDMLAEAADLGHAAATYALAVCYALGDVVEQNPEYAAMLFKKSAEAGYSKAKLSYGLDLIYGSNGIGEDQTLGMSFIKQAAEDGVDGASEEFASLQKRMED